MSDFEDEDIQSKYYDTISQTVKWIENSLEPTDYKNNREAMKYIIHMMDHSLRIMKIGVSLAPSDVTSERGYTKRRAIVLGHMIRIVKLYEATTVHTEMGQREIVMIFGRLIFEAVIRVEYLIQAKQKSYRSFVLASYKPEKEILTDLKQKAASRPLTYLETRMMRSIKSCLKADAITIKELLNNRTWSVDGKDFKSILTTIGWQDSYAYIFGIGSHYVHGTWHDLDSHHLEKDGRHYMPKFGYTRVDPRLACPITTLVMNSMGKYLKWSKSDPMNVVRPLVSALEQKSSDIDAAHEAFLESVSKTPS